MQAEDVIYSIYDELENWHTLNAESEKNQDLLGIEPGPLFFRTKNLPLSHTGSQW